MPPPPVGAAPRSASVVPADDAVAPGAAASVRTPLVMPAVPSGVTPLAASNGLRAPASAPATPALNRVIGRAPAVSGSMSDVVWTPGGKIGLGAAPMQAADEVDAWIAWVASDPAKFSFDGMSNADLGAVHKRIGELFREVSRPTTGSLQSTHEQARGVLFHALLAVIEKADKPLSDRAIATYERLVRAERVDGLRTMAARAFVNTGKVNAGIESLAFAKKPQYAEWLKDGVISIDYRIDDDGSKWEDAVELLEGLTTKKSAQADGSIIFERPASAGKHALRFHLSKPPKGTQPEIFAKMADVKTDIIVYSGHAGYGYGVRHALAQGVRSHGDGKLVVLMQCWGISNLNDIARAFPGAQLTSTTDSSTDTVDHMYFNEMFAGFDGLQSWAQIAERVKKRTQADYGNPAYKPDSHYFYPHTKDAVESASDLDADGASDIGDRVYTVSRDALPEPSRGLVAVKHAVPAWALRGDAVSEMISHMDTVFHYDKMLTPEQSKKVGWARDTFAMTGFFEPAAGDTSVFRFVRNGDKIELKVNAQFAHATSSTLVRLFAVEWSEFAASTLGLDATERSALTLAVLHRAYRAGASYRFDPLTTRDIAEPLAAKAYGWPVTTSRAVDRFLGDVEDFKPEHYQKFLAEFRKKPVILSTQLAHNPFVSLPLPAQVPMLPDSSEQEVALVAKLQLPGVILDQSLRGHQMTIVMEHGGARQLYSIVFSSDGKLRAVGRADIDLSDDERSILQDLADDMSAMKLAAPDFITPYFATLAAKGREVAIKDLEATLRKAGLKESMLKYRTRTAMFRLFGEARTNTILSVIQPATPALFLTP